ncbi:MAG: CoA pyrophosphatase [Acidimicrobiia bacterium]|nr:CoA pyrophosphatase [Acidimicrobiia bacterium]
MTDGSATGTDIRTLDRHRLEDLLDSHYEPSIPFEEPIHRAAVAAIFRPGADATELLLIQRAERLGDPWSGQMAFPGGRTDPTDASPESTAMRETREEIGLELGPDHAVGTLAELDGGRATNRLVLVSAHAYWLDGETPSLSPNYEVADTVWVPLPHLADPARHIDYYFPAAGASFPGIRLDGDGQVLWGLTLRFVGHLFERLGVPFLV